MQSTEEKRLAIYDEIDPVWLYTWQEVARTLLDAAADQLHRLDDPSAAALIGRIDALLAKKPGDD